MNLPTTTTTTTTTTTSSSSRECSNCGGSHNNKWVLHHVRLRGVHRRLCTSCVLRLHPSSFCPSCFLFYESNPPHPSKRLSCSNCSSFTHSHCTTITTTSTSTSTNPFLCPPCADPTFNFFDFNTNNRFLDKKLAVVLLCAAKIASASMGKAVIVARAEAERRVREAALARKRAREALEHVLFVESKVKDNKVRKIEDDHNNINNTTNNTTVSEVSGSGVVAKQTDKEKENEIFEGFDGFMEKNKEANIDGLKQNGTVNVKGGDLGDVLENNDHKSDVKHLQNNHANQQDITSK